jgi:MerR family redox-sensitive transcriptional activator SoxR
MNVSCHQHQSSSALEVKRKFCDTENVTKALTVGEVATRSGVATSALRFYEEEGLIHSERTDSGHRRYPREVIRRVAFIVFAQRIGLSLSEIRVELAKLPRNRVPERSD